MGLAKRAHHVGILIKDLERARGFYEGVLGLEQTERPDFGFPGVWYQLNDLQVHLLCVAPDKEVLAAIESPPLARHLAFQVDDYEETIAVLEKHGAEHIGFGRDVGQIFVRDPDGNTVELIVPGGNVGRTGSVAATRR